MITNAMAKMSFSKVKFIKNCYRSSMVQERLNSLAIMSTEYDILQKLDFEEVLKDFASTKLRNVNI